MRSCLACIASIFFDLIRNSAISPSNTVRGFAFSASQIVSRDRTEFTLIDKYLPGIQLAGVLHADSKKRITRSFTDGMLNFAGLLH